MSVQSKWLDRLRELENPEKRGGPPVPKVPKAPSVTFGTAPPRHVLENSAAELPDDPAMARRRERVLSVLRENPERHRHVIFDPDAEPGVVIATVAVRMAQGGIATGELRIPADRYDPFLILAMLQRAEQ